MELHGDTVAEEVKIPVPWGHVSGKWWGSRDKQPVLAIHGWQDNAGTYDTLMPLLPADISILCIDLPGHGFSSHLPPGQFYYIFWDGLSLVRRIVKNFRWKNITIMGHSLGGGIGYLYAACYPNEIEKLICIDIAGPVARDLQKIVQVAPECIDRFLKYETLGEDSVPCYEYDEMIDIVYDAYKGGLTQESSEILMKRGMSPAKSVNGTKQGCYNFSRDVRLKVSGLGLMTLDMVLEFGSKITCRVLNIRGKPGMKFEQPENYKLVLQKIKETAKSLDYIEVEGTHHLHLNNPERVAPYIIDFLKSQDI